MIATAAVNSTMQPSRPFVDHASAPTHPLVVGYLFWILGLFGVHRFYMGKIFTGILYLLTGGLLGIGYVYDTLTLNEQIEEINLQYT